MINSRRRKTGYFLIIIALILLIAVIFFTSSGKNLFKNIGRSPDPKVEKTDEEKFYEMIEERESLKVYSFDEEAEKKRDWDEDDFKQVARSFVERFGSYSNQSNYSNIEDLEVFMSAKMQDWAKRYVYDLRSSDNYLGEFYGIMTKALVEPEIIKFEPQKSLVEVMIETQREESLGTELPRSFKQSIVISFIKENGEWLVDAATWK